MAQLPLGTTKTAFNNTWSYVDPQYIVGLGVWRVYPGIPESADVTGIGAILPIVSTDLGPESIKISFDIEDLSSISTNTTTAYLTAAHGLIQQPSFSLPSMAPAGQNVVTIKLVQHLRSADKVVLYFDIKSLEFEKTKPGTKVGFHDTSSKKYKVAVKDYNNSNGVNIDSEAPMVDEVIGSTATFSFDITTLPKV